MTDFLDHVFPEQISRDGAVGGPGFSTDVVVVSSGDEFRNENWEQFRWRGEVSFHARVPIRIDPLHKHFKWARGRARAFPFKDWQDYIAKPGEGFFIASGSDWQMVKRYTDDGETYERIIRLPRNGRVTITGTGTLDYSTGLVTGGTPTHWQGEFYIPCRYDTDNMEGHIIDKTPRGELIMGWDSIPLIETRDFE